MADFDEFWAAYPRKVAKGDARKAWDRAARREPCLLALCLDALTWQRAQVQWTRDDGAFVPYPATWLNREQWADENPLAAKVAQDTEARRIQREWAARREALPDLAAERERRARERAS